MTSDEALMLQFQQGSGEAFTELFRRYREPIYGFFRRRLQDPPRAEELAQEVFLAVLKSSQRYEPRALFRTYLYGIAVKMVWAERRKSGRRSDISGSSRDGQDANEMPDPATFADPDAGLVVRDAVERLDAQEREILLLREYEQLSYEEIAAVMRVPVNTVRSRLFRARMALRDVLLTPRPQA
ncbi:MAG: sigma-70 family RNA polymerase sigma factor [Acidipila sp.]|nr:sigma-70 family RNA polymerase sigma factor [Acidipila sp.]